MEDNACTVTQPYTAELDSLRPGSMRTPASGDQVGSEGVPGWGLALIVAAVVGGTALAVRMRRTLN
jgi:hypothetical protein